MPGGRPARAIAAPRLVDFGPLPEPVQAAFDAVLGAFERDMGMPVEPIQPSEIFRAGSPSEDWMTLCALEHVHHFGWEFCEANFERFSPVFRDVVEFARKRPLDDYMVARRRRFEYVRELDLLLGDDAVLLTPTNCFQMMTFRRRRGRRHGKDGRGVRLVQHRPAEPHRASRDQRARGLDARGRSLRAPDHRAAVPRRHGALGRRGVGADEPVAARRARLRTVHCLSRSLLEHRVRELNRVSVSWAEDSPSSRWVEAKVGIVRQGVSSLVEDGDQGFRRSHGQGPRL